MGRHKDGCNLKFPLNETELETVNDLPVVLLEAGTA